MYMACFKLRDDLTQVDALESVSCALEQALALVDAIEDEVDGPLLQGRVFAVESILEAAQELVHHARHQAGKLVVTA